MEYYEKKYKDVLAKAREIHRNENEKRSDMEWLFPELAESEDEKIRKALVRFHKSTIDIDGIKGADILAWLEKQGEQKPIMNVPTREVILSIWDLGNEWKELTNGSISTEYGTQLDYIQKHWYESEYYLREKQGEQKSVLDFKASNWYVSKVDGKIHDLTYNPADKIEPKFKVGDYIVSDYCMGRVVEITNDAYLLDTEQGIPFSCRSIRLWDITKDAKDGDVLASDNSIFIFQEEYIAEKPIAYCGLMNGLFIKGEDACWTNEKCHPATKEQRELLFQKMNEAGYEWDAEKLELKKIEDEIEIPFGAKDSELQEATYYIPKGFHAEIDDDKVVIMKGEKSAWSDEDEGMKENIEGALDCYESMVSEDWEKEKEWLKFIKDRIGG